ncbi:transcriptional regulator [Alteromonadaceae bacterium M269]|nr:transcriptional regulator [Alteromonadaceae bacterium M269]
MTQSKIEKLSSLIDGESQDEQLIDEISTDAELSKKWQSYHLTRDLMRKDAPELLNFDISAQVAKAIADEPSIVAPKPSRLESLPVIGNVIPLIKQSGQFAIAASVAAAVIIGVQQYNQPLPDEPYVVTNSTNHLGSLGVASGVSLEQTRPIQNQRSDAQEQRRRINALLRDHQNQMRLKSQPQQAEQLEEEKDVKGTNEKPTAEQK